MCKYPLFYKVRGIAQLHKLFRISDALIYKECYLPHTFTFPIFLLFTSFIMTQTKLALAISALFFSSIPLQAMALETDPIRANDKNSLLDTVTVVGTRTETLVKNTPVSVSVIEREAIEKRGVDSVAELLRDIPGISVVDSAAAGMKRIRIRGEQSNRVVIFVDGQELTDHSSFGSPFLVDPANIERIEVVRGPASVLYGAKAIGGVVNIITRKGAAQPVEVEVGGAYHSGTQGYRAMASIGGTVDQFDYRLTVSGDDHGDRKVARGTHSPNSTQLDNSSFENKDISLHLGQRFGEQNSHYLSFKANHHSLEAQGWEDNFALVKGLPATGIVNGVTAGEVDVTQFNANLPKRDLNKVGLYYEGLFNDSLLQKITADVFYQQVDREFSNALRLEGDNVKYNTFPPSYIALSMDSTSQDKTTTYGGSTQFDFVIQEDHYTILGAQLVHDRLKTDKNNRVHILSITPPSTFPGPKPPSHLFPMEVGNNTANEEASMSTLSAYVQDEWSLPNDVKLTLGGRYYHVKSELENTNSTNHSAGESNSNSRFVKAAGLTYSGLSHTTLRASYGEGYVVPTLLEQFTDSRAGRGIVLHGNPDLDPERSRNYELGLRYQNRGVVFDGTLFYSQAKDYITFENCTISGLCTGGDRYINADKAKSFGAEVVIEYWIADTAYTPYLNATWMRRQISVNEFSTYDTDLPNVSGQIGVRYENFIGENEVWGDFYLQGATDIDKKERDIALSGKESRHLAGWATANFSIGTLFGQQSQHKIMFHANNLTNKHYRASVDEMPAMGRNFVLSFNSQF